MPDGATKPVLVILAELADMLEVSLPTTIPGRQHGGPRQLPPKWAGIPRGLTFRSLTSAIHRITDSFGSWQLGPLLTQAV